MGVAEPLNTFMDSRFPFKPYHQTPLASAPNRLSRAWTQILDMATPVQLAWLRLDSSR